MQELAERGWFLLCSLLGRALRSARYSNVWIVERDGELAVRKDRVFFAPVLIWMGGRLMRTLDTGVRILPQGEWEERERLVWRSVRGVSIGVDAGGVLVLPRLKGRTLAGLLEDPELEESVRRRAIELAVGALAELHAEGFTHADAMAENVMVDLDDGRADWFDFETVHDSSRPMAWRRADDVRALLATCLLRTDRGRLGEVVSLVLDAYGDEEVGRLVVASFSSVLRRSLVYHLAQAGLCWESFREMERMPPAIDLPSWSR